MTVERQHLDALRIDRSGDEQRAPRRWPLVVGAAVVLLVILGVWAIARPSGAKVRVAAATAVTGNAKSTVLNATGYVTARRQATVSSKITARVLEVEIEEGMRVAAGQILARLDASIPDRSLRLARAQEAEARSSLAETRVRIEQARIDLERASNLHTEKISSRADLDKARADLDALKARLVSQQDALAVSSRQVALRQQDVEDTLIRAPFAGVVVTKAAQPGEMISPISAGGGFTRTGVCTIVDMDSLEIEVDVAEAYINRVYEGQRVEATLDAYPEWRIPAHVITVIPTADRQKATFRVRIAFDIKDPRILPDMGVKVSFIEKGNSPAVQQTAVPRTAIRRDGERDVVFVVAGENRVERRAVNVISSEGDVARVSGVTPGENVVIEGPEALKDGDRVVPQKPAAK